MDCKALGAVVLLAGVFGVVYFLISSLTSEE